MSRLALMTMFLLLWPLSVQSQQTRLFCGPHLAMLELLKEQYGEEIIANALDSEDRHIEFFRNPKTKSWTIIITVAENVSCVIGAGHQMEVPNIDGKKCAGLVNAI